MARYTKAQKKAYYSGMGYCAGKKGKRIPFKSKKNENSFRKGYADAIETVKKYPNR